MAGMARYVTNSLRCLVCHFKLIDYEKQPVNAFICHLWKNWGVNAFNDNSSWHYLAYGK